MRARIKYEPVDGSFCGVTVCFVGYKRNRREGSATAGISMAPGRPLRVLSRQCPDTVPPVSRKCPRATHFALSNENWSHLLAACVSFFSLKFECRKEGLEVSGKGAGKTE